MKTTKMDMAKVIVTALYNLPELVTEQDKVAWKHALRIARSMKEHVQCNYDTAVKVLNERKAKKAQEASAPAVESPSGFWKCRDCGHEVIAHGHPEPIRWTDGHICYFIPAKEE